MARFIMPAEWTEHERCWMAWPCQAKSWPNGLDDARAAFAAVANAIAHFEPVTMLARPADVAGARRSTGDGVDVVGVALDDSWARDIGPTFVIDDAGDVAGIDWGFNGWGLVHPEFAQDARAARHMLELAGIRRLVGPQILEGGSIHVDGEGTLLTTEECLLDPDRNPHLTKADIEHNLKTWFGCTTVIWLRRGLTNDETRGHVDNLACFSAPGEVLLPTTDDVADPDYHILNDASAMLMTSRDAAGRSLSIRRLPTPPRRYDGWGRAMALSYVNFYLPNRGLIMPGFDPSADAEAAAVLREAFPDREIIVVPGHAIAAGGGNIHCITMQQPISRTGPKPQAVPLTRRPT